MTRTSMSSLVEGDNVQMASQHPRSDGPRRRRAFTASEKLAHLDAYEAACEQHDGGGYLRREGLYSSLISECHVSGLREQFLVGEALVAYRAVQRQLAGDRVVDHDGDAVALPVDGGGVSSPGAAEDDGAAGERDHAGGGDGAGGDAAGPARPGGGGGFRPGVVALLGGVWPSRLWWRRLL